MGIDVEIDATCDECGGNCSAWGNDHTIYCDNCYSIAKDSAETYEEKADELAYDLSETKKLLEIAEKRLNYYIALYGQKL